MKSDKEILLAKLKELSAHLADLRAQREKNEVRMQITLARIDSLVRTLETFGYNVPESDLPIEFRPQFTGNVADHIEQLLRDSQSPMERHDITRILVNKRRIEPKNARITVYNAIKRDKQNRFKTSPEGKVSLRKE